MATAQIIKYQVTEAADALSFTIKDLTTNAEYANAGVDISSLSNFSILVAKKRSTTTTLSYNTLMYIDGGTYDLALFDDFRSDQGLKITLDMLNNPSTGNVDFGDILQDADYVILVRINPNTGDSAESASNDNFFYKIVENHMFNLLKSYDWKPSYYPTSANMSYPTIWKIYDLFVSLKTSASLLLISDFLYLLDNVELLVNECLDNTQNMLSCGCQ